MKQILTLLFIATLGITAAEAQDYKFADVDKSPADIVYYPLNITKDKAPDSKPLIKIVYSRPNKNGRPIFGVLEQFGKVWRSGANEATEIRFFETVKIGDTMVESGTYSLFTIPEKDKWTVIINSGTDKWGAFFYDQAKDVARVEVPVKSSPKVIEAFSITFTDRADGANLIMGWDQTVVEVPVLFKW